MTFWFSMKLKTMVTLRYLKYKFHLQAQKRTCSSSWGIRKYLHLQKKKKKGKAFTRKSESRQHGYWSQTPPFLRSHTDSGSLPALPHIKGAVSLTFSLVQMEVYPSMCPTRPPYHCSLYPKGAQLFLLCPCTLLLLLPATKSVFLTM